MTGCEPATTCAHLAPAMFQAFDAETSDTAVSPSDATVRNGVWTVPGWASWAWISSAITATPCSSASAAMAASVSAEGVMPVGLCGLQSR
ncbi:unannotated protein [freshwater metagenome]|uniref:Unannotated protein n=1 Tax=freshwater metagenome TaxID=449393 RepID=A0A6J6TNF3_9ZZZZ